MDDEIREAFAKSERLLAEFKKTQTHLLAAYTLTQALMKAHQVTLVQVAAKIGLVSVKNQPFEQWFREAVRQEVKKEILKCNDEQLGAEIEELLKHHFEPPKSD